MNRKAAELVGEDVERILFVDDEKRILTALRMIFRTEYEVFTANSGPEALEIVRAERIHVIVSDQRMPDMLGHEVLREVRKIEVLTRGQVNAFGLPVNEYGDFFTADCHTKPISLLVPGGYHESFGKPHDGLGFIPRIMEHIHGSTAICGIAFGSATHFPKNYRDSVFSGNVTTCRINQNKLVYTGSSPHAIEQPDFLSTTDPWFRPVDLKISPQGDLFVADFYNAVIGHYEVPLDHPKRDRTSGRISDAGAYGSVPWLDLGNGFGAYLVIEADAGIGGELASLLFEPVEAAVLAGRAG